MQTCSNCGEENSDRARFCQVCATPLATAPAVRASERKVVTVLFCDMVGFTAASDNADPEDVQARLGPYHLRLRTEIERYGGTVEKFIGDAVMAVFGAPVAHEDDPERAVRAGLRILEAIEELNEADPTLGLQVRVGVNTGEAVVALGARPGAGEGIVTGDVVNTASRLQGVAPTGGVVVGEQTYRATDAVFDYEALEPVTVKGKTEAVPIWQALTARSRFGTDLTRTHATPLVGRQIDLGILSGAFNKAVQESSVQLVTIVGEPGVGKSRLVAELFSFVDALPDVVRWRQGRCLPYGEGITFWALGEIVKAEAGILESDSPESAASKLDAVLPGGTDREWLRQRLLPLIGLEASSTVEREEAFTAWRRFLESMADERPSVFVFEDLQWADEAMLAFLEHLADWSEGVPMLLLATARPELYERHHTFAAAARNTTRINLSPLTETETSKLISVLLDQAVLPAEVQSLILERAGGNPLYAEEFARMLKDRGLLVQKGKTLALAVGADVPFPEGVQALIAARLDTLSPERKAILQDAAVIGKVFWAGAVAAMGDINRKVVTEALHELSRKELVRPARASSMEGEAEYAFFHTLVRDVAYAQIPRAGRSEKHRRAAEWIESLGRPDDQVELVAHHVWAALELARAAGLDDADLLERVIASSELAADRAMALASFGAAAGLYARALELVAPDDTRRPRLLARCGNARFTADGSGLEMLRDAVTAFLEAGDVEGAAEAATRGARVAWYRGDHSAAYELIDQAVALVRDLPPSRAKALALVQRGSFHLFMGEYEKGMPLARAGLAAAEAVGLDEARVHALNVIGTCRSMLGDADGVHDIQAAVALGREVQEFDRLHASLNNLAVAYWLQGRAREAGEVQEELAASVERYGKAHDRTWNQVLTAERHYIAGRWDEALRVSDGFIARVEAGSPDYMEGACRVLRTSILMGRGDLAGAERESERALAAGRQGKDAQMLGPALTARAMVAFASGRRDEAKTFMFEALEHDPVAALLNEVSTFAEVMVLMLDLGLRHEMARVLDSLPASWPWVRVGRAIGQRDFTAAADVLGEMPYPATEALVRLRAGEALVAEGQREAAAIQLERALPFFHNAGATAYLRRAESLLESASRAG